MRSAMKFLIPALAASLTLAACGSSSSNSSSSSQAAATPASTTSTSSGESAAVVKTASNAGLRATVLVNAQGMTLYALSGEQNGKFICTSSACTQVWHPLSAPAGTPSGSVGSLATVKRPDGTVQVTYKGMPLYTFAQDQAPGETKGQGIKDVGTWTVVTVGSKSSSSAPAAAAPTTTPAAPATKPAESESAPPASSGGGSSGGYSY
jgi:predicted lipoprotein with Yx(FWY)xxD motif